MSKIEILVGPFKKKIKVPASKSYANRALIIASTLKQSVQIKNLPLSTDFIILMQSLEKIGLIINKEAHSVTVVNSFPECEKKSKTTISLKTGDGGTTNRFLIPLLARGQNKYIIIPDDHFKSRPINDLLAPLKQLNIQIEGPNENHANWLSIQGPYQDKNIKLDIDCSASTQFASALLMGLHDFSNISFSFLNLKGSKTYLEMTLNMIKDKNTSLFQTPVDYSSVSYPMALAALSGSVFIKDAQVIDPFQADSIFIEILKCSGADIQLQEKGLFVSHQKKLNPINWDCSLCPDLVPALSFLCSYIKGTSQLFNIKSLRFKECDRIDEISNILTMFLVEHSYDLENDCLTIKGKESHQVLFKDYTPPQDHRMIMLTYLFMRMEKGGLLGNSQFVNKSFANFYEVMNA